VVADTLKILGNHHEVHRLVSVFYVVFNQLGQLFLDYKEQLIHLVIVRDYLFR
jgi:hypothetical protein